MGEMQPGTHYRKGYPELMGEFSMEKLQELLETLPQDVIPSWAEDAGRAAGEKRRAGSRSGICDR
jgi:hypothetical protein